MTIHGELTLEDHRQAQCLLYLPYVVGLWWSFPIYLALQIFLGLSVFIWVFACAVYFPNLVRLVQYLIARFGSDRTFQKYLITRENTPGPLEIEVTDEGISIFGPDSYQQIRLNKSCRQYKSGLDIILASEPHQYQIFPHRWFTEEQYAEFEAYLLRHGSTPRPRFSIF